MSPNELHAEAWRTASLEFQHSTKGAVATCIWGLGAVQGRILVKIRIADCSWESCAAEPCLAGWTNRPCGGTADPWRAAGLLLSHRVGVMDLPAAGP
jgi:hypothetical protein